MAEYRGHDMKQQHNCSVVVVGGGVVCAAVWQEDLRACTGLHCHKAAALWPLPPSSGSSTRHLSPPHLALSPLHKPFLISLSIFSLVRGSLVGCVCGLISCQISAWPLYDASSFGFNMPCDVLLFMCLDMIKVRC